MPDPQTANATTILQRYDRIDIARGVALIGVVVFHLCWDLRYYEFVLWPMDTNWGWIGFQKSLVAAFVGLSGLSLWLAHGKGIRWRPFWRRLVVLCGAAFLITVATWLTFPPAFVYFGVLHALALFALMGLLFLRLPVLPLAAIGIAIVVLGIGFHHPAFNEKPLSWLGFWQVPPYTNDLVPVFPWFGVFLCGMALGRRLTLPEPQPVIAAPPSWGRIAGALKWTGRHTLILYLVHQPLLLGIIIPLDALLQPSTWHRAERFLSECRPSCETGRADPAYCARYCTCSLEQIEQGDLWEAITRIDPTPDETNALNAMVTLCTAMGRSTPE